MVVIALTWWDRVTGYTDWSWGEKILRTAVVYFAIVILLRLFGKRELAQLNSFDLVVLLLLSNVVQNAIIGPETSLLGGLLGAATLLALNMLVVRIARREPKVDKLFEGAQSEIVTDGEFDEKEMARLVLRKGDVETAIRRQGGNKVEEVEHAWIYPGGAIVVQLRPNEENATRGDIERLDQKLDQLIAAQGS